MTERVSRRQLVGSLPFLGLTAFPAAAGGPDAIRTALERCWPYAVRCYEAGDRPGPYTEADRRDWEMSHRELEPIVEAFRQLAAVIDACLAEMPPTPDHAGVAEDVRYRIAHLVKEKVWSTREWEG